LGGQRIAGGRGEDLAIIGEASFFIVEHAAERPLRIEVEPGHGGFLDSQTKPGGLHPEL
jgi:hypothetical protein